MLVRQFSEWNPTHDEWKREWFKSRASPSRRSRIPCPELPRMYSTTTTTDSVEARLVLVRNTTREYRVRNAVGRLRSRGTPIPKAK